MYREAGIRDQGTGISKDRIRGREFGIKEVSVCFSAGYRGDNEDGNYS